MQSVHFLLFCLLVPFCARAQECSPEDQKVAEEKVKLTDFVALLSVEIPENCGDFVALRLVPCRNELDVIEGCCTSACENLFKQYTNECMQSLTATLCASGERAASAVQLLDRMAARCDDDYAPLSCETDSEEETEEETEEEEEEDNKEVDEDEPEEDDTDEEEEAEEEDTEEVTDKEEDEDDKEDEDASEEEGEDAPEEDSAPAPGSLIELEITDLEFDESEG